MPASLVAQRKLASLGPPACSAGGGITLAFLAHDVLHSDQRVAHRNQRRPLGTQASNVRLHEIPGRLQQSPCLRRFRAQPAVAEERPASTASGPEVRREGSTRCSTRCVRCHACSCSLRCSTDICTRSSQVIVPTFHASARMHFHSTRHAVSFRRLPSANSEAKPTQWSKARCASLSRENSGLRCRALVSLASLLKLSHGGHVSWSTSMRLALGSKWSPRGGPSTTTQLNKFCLLRS